MPDSYRQVTITVYRTVSGDWWWDATLKEGARVIGSGTTEDQSDAWIEASRAIRDYFSE